MKRITLLILAAVLLLAAGCSEKPAEIDPTTPTGALEGAMNAFKTLEAEDFDKYFASGSEEIMGDMLNDEEYGQQTNELYTAIFAKLEWKITGEDVDEDAGTAVVTIDVTGISMEDLQAKAAASLSGSFSEGTSSEDMMKAYVEAIKANVGNVETVTTSLAVDMVSSGGEWKVGEDYMKLSMAAMGMSGQ